jgi:hypothetical protein
VSVATRDDGGRLVLEETRAHDVTLLGAAQSIALNWKTSLKSIAYWAAWVCFEAWALRCQHVYLMNGWWMVLLVFWFTASVANPAHYYPGRLRFISLALVTIGAAFLIYGTFEWLQEIADGWSWGPPGQRFRLVAIPVRALVSAFLTAAILVPQLRRYMRPHSVVLLILAALPVGLAEYGSGIGSVVHWRQYWLGSCIELFIVIILPLVLVAVNDRLGTVPWRNGRFVTGLGRVWRGEAPIWVALIIMYPLTIAGVFALISSVMDIPIGNTRLERPQLRFCLS